MLDVPVYQAFVPRQLTRERISGSIGDASGWRMTAREYDELNAPLLSVQGRLVEMGGRFLDPRPYMVDPESATFQVELGGVSMYSDFSHLTIPAAVRIFPQMLEDQLRTPPRE